MIGLLLIALPLHVILPEAKNLQNLSYWVAVGAGHFHDEGIDVIVDVAETPGEVGKLLARDDAQVAVLPPPIYIDLISERKPWRLVANLLKNDPINVIVRRATVEARHLRLKDFDVVVMTGHEQNDALASGRVDALFAHTPFLERALLDQDMVMVVNQSAGEVPEVAFTQIHVLAVKADFAANKPELVRALYRAIARAEKLIHTDPAAATAAICKALPELPRRNVEALVRLYQPAVPATPEVSVAGIEAALKLYPATKVPPDLHGIDLHAFVLTGLGNSPASPSRAKMAR